MLTGEFNHSIDSKGRLIIPSKLRESLGEHFVITKGMDGCLFLYPDNEWKAFEEKLRTLPLTNKKARDFKRFFLLLSRHLIAILLSAYRQRPYSKELLNVLVGHLSHFIR